MTMTGTIEGQPKAKASKSCFLLCFILYKTQNNSPFLAKVMKEPTMNSSISSRI
jgi:hypothetical protein